MHTVFFFFVVLRPDAGHGLLVLEVSRSHTTTHHIQYDSSGRVISSSQRPLPDNTRHSQQTNIHAPGGTQTHNLSRRVATDLRLRPHSQWDRLYTNITIHITQEATAIQTVTTYSTSFSLVNTSTWACRISITCLDASYSSSVALKSSCNTDT